MSRRIPRHRDVVTLHSSTDATETPATSHHHNATDRQLQGATAIYIYMIAPDRPPALV